ncbi:MAG TPA: hypothetical protein V6D23_26555 [Candidatus Obscuribacterales bacterium]
MQAAFELFQNDSGGHPIITDSQAQAIFSREIHLQLHVVPENPLPGHQANIVVIVFMRQLLQFHVMHLLFDSIEGIVQVWP